MANENVQKRLADLVEGTGRDVEWAQQAFAEKRERAESLAQEDLDPEEVDEWALNMVSAALQKETRLGGGGEETELKVLAIGHQGVWENFGKQNKTMVHSYGLIRGPIGKEGKVKTGKAVFLNDAAHVDPATAQSRYHARNTLRAWYGVRESKDLPGVYVCNSIDQTELTEEEFDDLPSDPDEKNDLLREAFPDVPLAEIDDHLSSFDPDSGFTREFGADVKRFRGTVHDHYIKDDRSWGCYTLMDSSVTADDVEADPAIMGENQQVPGLTVHCEPDYHMNYGDESVLDVYGCIETNKDGQIQMRAYGIVPIIATDLDDDSQAADDGVKAKRDQL